MNIILRRSTSVTAPTLTRILLSLLPVTAATQQSSDFTPLFDGESMNGIHVNRAENIVNPEGSIGIQGETGIVEYRFIGIREL